MDGYDTIKVLTDGTLKRNFSNAIYVIGSKAGIYESIRIDKDGSHVKSTFSTLAEAEAQIPEGYSVCGKFASGNIESPLPKEQVFVFGSNLDGNHNGGAAAVALRIFGARNGSPEGLVGSKRRDLCTILSRQASASISLQKTPYQSATANWLDRISDFL